MIAVTTYRVGAFFAPKLPVRLSEAITDGLVDMQYTARRVTRAVTVENLRAVMGPEVSDRELRRSCHCVMRHFGRAIYHFLRMPSVSHEDLRGMVDYGGVEPVVRELVAQGGFIMVGPHIGPWEVGGAALGALGARIHTVALPHPSERVTRFFREQRRRVGVYSYPIGRAGKSMVRALSRGDQVALLIDRAYGTRTERTEVFGRTVDLPTGHAALAVRTNVPILSVVCVFGEDGRFAFDFRGPHVPDAALAADEAEAELHARCLADMEFFIRKYPEQWFHFKPFGNPS